MAMSISLWDYLLYRCQFFFFFFKDLILFIFGCIGSSLPHAGFFSSCGERGLLFLVVSSLVVEHWLQAHGLQQLWLMDSVVVAHSLQSTGSVVVAHGLTCSAACGIFPDQGLSLSPLHWKVDSYPLCHQGSPVSTFFSVYSFVCILLLTLTLTHL